MNGTAKLCRQRITCLTRSSSASRSVFFVNSMSDLFHVSKKTLSNIEAIIYRVWQCGIRWGVVPPGNRMALVELRGIRPPGRSSAASSPRKSLCRLQATSGCRRGCA